MIFEIEVYAKFTITCTMIPYSVVSWEITRNYYGNRCPSVRLAVINKKFQKWWIMGNTSRRFHEPANIISDNCDKRGRTSFLK